MHLQSLLTQPNLKEDPLPKSKSGCPFLVLPNKYISYRSQLKGKFSSEGNDRVGRILDSIANISISQSKDEVVAVAVQIRKMDVRLIVASSNGTLPNSTTTYLREIWGILKQLSNDYQDSRYRISKLSTVPKRPPTRDLSEDMRGRVHNLRRKILRFGHQKLRLRVSKHYFSIISINSDVAKELALEPMIKQLNIIKPTLDQPGPLADKIWHSVWKRLEIIRFLFDKFASSSSSSSIKKIENTPFIPFPLFRYLSKVVSVIRDIKILLNAAYSSRLRRAFFQRDFQIINLNDGSGSGSIPNSLLPPPISRATARWTQLVENTLLLHNMTAKENGKRILRMDEIKVRQHVVKMICEGQGQGQYLWNNNDNNNKKRPSSSLFVHCELNLVSYILQSSADQGQGGFLDQIGVSKLSCTGCAQFIQAIEDVSGKRFKLKGTDHRFDYPWAFPPHIPPPSPPSLNSTLESVAERMRKNISFIFGQTYDGFYPA